MTHLSHEGPMPGPATGPHEGHPLGSTEVVIVRYGHEPEPYGWVVPGQQKDSDQVAQDAVVAERARIQAIDARAKVADAHDGVPSRSFDASLPVEDL